MPIPAIVGLALSIISSLAPAAPAVAKMVLGDKGEEVAKTIVNTAEAISGQRGSQVVDALKADPAKLAQFLSELMGHQADWAAAELNAQKEVIIAESKSESWLTRNWRPLIMLDFGVLITAYWMGWSSPTFDDSVVIALLEIVKYGLSGYVVGRSGEKIAPYMAEIFKRVK